MMVGCSSNMKIEIESDTIYNGSIDDCSIVKLKYSQPYDSTITNLGGIKTLTEYTFWNVNEDTKFNIKKNTVDGYLNVKMIKKHTFGNEIVFEKYTDDSYGEINN
jgi:hypothetical protein